MIKSEFEYKKKKNGTTERVPVKYMSYSHDELYDIYTNRLDHDYFYSETSLTQSIKRLQYLYKKGYKDAVSFFNTIGVDPQMIQIKDIIENGYVALKTRKEILDSDRIDSFSNYRVSEEGRTYYPINLSPINVVNSATVIALMKRFKEPVFNSNINNYIFVPTVKKSSAIMEELPINSISQAVKLMKKIWGFSYNEYVQILKKVIGPQIGNLSIKDAFYYEDHLSYITLKNCNETSQTVIIEGETYSVIKIKRLCVKSFILSIISKQIMENSEKICFLKQYEDSLKFNNRRLIVKTSDNKKKQKQKSNEPKKKREWVHIIYTPMGLGKRR